MKAYEKRKVTLTKFTFRDHSLHDAFVQFKDRETQETGRCGTM